jgi:hypothetical protein
MSKNTAESRIIKKYFEINKKLIPKGLYLSYNEFWFSIAKDGTNTQISANMDTIEEVECWVDGFFYNAT